MFFEFGELVLEGVGKFFVFAELAEVDHDLIAIISRTFIEQEILQAMLLIFPVP